MTLSSIALRNIQRNFKDYFVYFASMIFSIVIYFTFKALQYNSQMEKAAEASKKISGAFQVSSVMLIIFVAVFIIYSNGFFTRKRKKEVGLYSLLGIRKRQIGKMLFYENMLMGLMSLIIGIAIGSVLSKLFLELLVSMMGLKLNVHFEVPMAAIVDTAIIFFVIILYTSLQGYRLIYRFKLIELFRAEREGEAMPKGSVIMALISVFLIGSGYFLALMYMKAVMYADFMVVALYILLATVAGTYLLFMFFTVFILKRARNNKSAFYNGMNMVTTSQLLYRIKGNAKSLATIAILSAVTLTAVGTSVTMYYNTFTQSKVAAPYSYSYEKKDEALDKKVNEILAGEKSNHPVTYELELEMIPVKGTFKGERADQVLNTHYNVTKQYQLISQSNFNTIAKHLDIEPVNLSANEAFVYDSLYIETLDFGPLYTGNTAVFPVGNESKELKIKGVNSRSVTNLNELFVIVPDQTYEQAKQVNETRIVKNIDVKGERNSKELTAKLASVMPAGESEILKPFHDFYTGFQTGLETTGLMMFIGLFLGLVFLLATGSIIYFKQLTEASADRDRYVVLHKVGVTKQEMKKAIAKQVSFIFAIPLVIGILHSLFALKGLGNILPYEIMIPLLISIGVYGVIYIGYYFLTVRSYYKIVSAK
ncbi:ABC transporter permease [Bacillus cereus]|uniref:ABC transporter permease n=1 Tax=Bacillus thuringiensis TaxID=1428 RepID=A0A0B5X4F5_BACTU|nr:MULTISPECIES: ABC transporter permease [Bacillus cereus group]AJG74522.1 ftsX-like permease family protein [Bacillus thuringiensis]AJH61918.1 ftsX-like permease family protein [Bacillus cereus]AJH83025.1 ftsX-like permease family protein [Bacillus thuringiensis]AJK32253.1 ftsX-like permease family protein [Bacillus cereus]KWU64208.1 ABC transporter permease [Bacillus cereus]